jgi:hypothetical protein
MAHFFRKLWPWNYNRGSGTLLYLHLAWHIPYTLNLLPRLEVPVSIFWRLGMRQTHRQTSCTITYRSYILTSAQNIVTFESTVPLHYLYIFFFMALRPNAGHGLLILDVSRSHTTKHYSRYDSSGQVISTSQRHLPDNKQHSRQTAMPLVGFEPTISAGERPHTYALDRAAISRYLKWSTTPVFLNLCETAAQ